MAWVSRSIRGLVLSSPRVAFTRHFAAAAGEQRASDKLSFTLASPTKVFFNSTVVRQVDVPTLAGSVGVLAQHVPTIGSLKPGVVNVYSEDGGVTKIFVSSGSFVMNIDGSCQVLAEEAVKLDDIDEALARQEMDNASRRAAEGSEVDRAEAGIAFEVAEAMVKAVGGQ